MLIINSFEEFTLYRGAELGFSNWYQIDRFADATQDYQWIHIDKEKAEKEGPFKSTIAHGYLT